MAVNRGKDFEAQVRKSFEEVPDTFVMRLIDPQNGFAGVRNICDFIVYHNPILYLVECKSCYGQSLPFANITSNQWDGLLANSKYTGVVPCYIIWFIDQDKTLFITARAMSYLRQRSNRSSINVNTFSTLLPEYLQNDYTLIPGKKRRIFYDYDMTSIFKIGEKLWDK